MERYFLDNDGEGNWYLIPKANRSEWLVWQEDYSNGTVQRVPDYAEQLAGDPSDVTFTDPRVR